MTDSTPTTDPATTAAAATPGPIVKASASSELSSTGFPAAAMTLEEREQRLHELFESFASFGASSSRPSVAAATDGPLIDSARFVKFFRDTGLLDSHLTQTTLDIHFAKAKSQFKRADRKLPFDAFLYALQLAAVSKYGGAMSENEALEQIIIEACNGSGPIARGTVTATGGIYSKLTDPTLYTGQHKDKPTGSSGGASREVTIEESRTSRSKSRSRPGSRSASRSGSVSDLTSALAGASISTPRAAAATASFSTLSSTSAGPSATTGHSPRASRTSLAYKPTASSTSRMSLAASGATGGSRGNLTGSNAKLGSPDYVPTVPSIPKGSVFDRLTNTKGYTGSHRERFDEDGRGRGKAGRVQENVGTQSLEKLVSRN
ncbi:hypothetical protein BC828DRAFT_26943 [Blastocladiella britannica]|nr:hypothetical protein BC828DRAFT_26943 [Blastocladiella britannica]